MLKKAKSLKVMLLKLKSTIWVLFLHFTEVEIAIVEKA